MVGDGTWLSVGEAAGRLRVGVDAVRRAIDQGRLTAGRTPGGHRRVSEESVRRLFAELWPGATYPGEPGDGPVPPQTPPGQ